MKVTILIASAILGASIIFASARRQPAREPATLPMHTVQRDGRVSAVINLGNENYLHLLATKHEDDITFASVAYQMDGNTAFMHSDTSKDGTLDELHFLQPPFEDLRLFSRNDDGTYRLASTDRHEEVKKTERIYDETFRQVFSGDLTPEQANQAIEEAHKKVGELRER